MLKNPTMSIITENLDGIRRRIREAATRVQRDPGEVCLIAVSKTKDVPAIKQALEAGQMVFGENRVQEASLKFTDLRTYYSNLDLHLIGPVQTNKVDTAVALFDVIHTVDRPKLAEALAKAIVKSGRAPRLSIEVNIGREPQKAGIMPEALPEFLTYCRDSLGLKIQGLMCIPPQGEDPRPFFQQMKKLADQHHLPNLSMGMSADFEDAIMCGATEVRVGSAIFGERFLH